MYILIILLFENKRKICNNYLLLRVYCAYFVVKSYDAEANIDQWCGEHCTRFTASWQPCTVNNSEFELFTLYRLK